MVEHEIFPMNAEIGQHTFMFNVSDIPYQMWKIRLFVNKLFVCYTFHTDPNEELISKLQDEILKVLKSTVSLESIEFHKIDDLHLSLTRTVVLRHHWINEFVQSVEQSLQNTNRYLL